MFHVEHFFRRPWEIFVVFARGLCGKAMCTSAGDASGNRQVSRTSDAKGSMSWVAEYQLGRALQSQGQLDEAMLHFYREPLR